LDSSDQLSLDGQGHAGGATAGHGAWWRGAGSSQPGRWCGGVAIDRKITWFDGGRRRRSERMGGDSAAGDDVDPSRWEEMARARCAPDEERRGRSRRGRDRRCVQRMAALDRRRDDGGDVAARCG
jgi:hypothetical protein